MENIAKALKDLQKALESNPNVKTVKVTITLQKPAAKNSRLKRVGRGERTPLVSPIISHKTIYVNGRTNLMKITKGKIEYAISENLNSWMISFSERKLVVEYKIPKSVCSTLNELEKLILTSDEFGG